MIKREQVWTTCGALLREQGIYPTYKLLAQHIPADTNADKKCLAVYLLEWEEANPKEKLPRGRKPAVDATDVVLTKLEELIQRVSQLAEVNEAAILRWKSKDAVAYASEAVDAEIVEPASTTSIEDWEPDTETEFEAIPAEEKNLSGELAISGGRYGTR